MITRHRRVGSTALLFSAVSLFFEISTAQTGIITTIAGGYFADGGPAAAELIEAPRSIAAGPDGTLYIVDTINVRIRRIAPDGSIHTFAGVGTTGFKGDGGPAVAAELNQPAAVATAADGSVYVSDSGNHRLRRVGADGIISTIAGNGTVGSSGDGGPAARAQFVDPKGIAVWGDGVIYLADGAGCRIRRIGVDGIISTVAGIGRCGFFGDGGQATEAWLNYPIDVALATDGSLYFSDERNNRIRKVGPDGIIQTVAGSGRGGSSYGFDGGPATIAGLFLPTGVVVLGDGTIMFSEFGNHRVRRVGTDGIITTVAGQIVPGFSGDGSDASNAYLSGPWGLAFGVDDSLYIADSINNRIRRIQPNLIITTVMGLETAAVPNGDGLPATNARLASSAGLAFAGDGSLLIADSDNHSIRRIDGSGLISTIAGTGVPGFSGDGGPAAAAQFNLPESIAIGDDGVIYIADFQNHAIRRIGTDGNVSTVAGTGQPGFSGDGGPAIHAQLQQPFGIAIATDGTLYVADSGNGRVRRVDIDGTITTVAGGLPFRIEDGYPAKEAFLEFPVAVALAGDNSFYIVDHFANTVRRVGPDGIINTVAGLIDDSGFSGDGGPATNALLDGPFGIALTDTASFYVVDAGNGRVRHVDGDGVITTIAGNGLRGLSGDGGLATDAAMLNPTGLTRGPDGSLWIADSGNSRVRKITFASSAWPK